MRRKLVLIVVDGLAPDTLATAIASGAAPNLRHARRARRPRARRLDVPVADAGLPLDDRDRRAARTSTRIPALQWYHRGEQRFVEYGSSFQATLVEGAKQSVDDAIVNLNHVHLSPKLRTLFELVEDAGMVAASVNFPSGAGGCATRSSTRCSRGFARRTGFMDAAYGPSQFYFGELFATERTGRTAEPRRGRSQRRQRRGRGALARGARRLRLPALLPARDRLGRAQGRRCAAPGGRRGRRRARSRR